LAVEKLTACPYDLCLLDMNLPDFSGVELMRIIRDICPNSKIVIMTASSIDCPELSGYVDAAIKNGACHFILKPFSLCEVTDTLGNLLNEGDNFHTGLRFTGSGFVKKTRRSERRLYFDSIIFQMTVIDQGETKRWNFEAQSTDICEDGIGLLARFSLKISQVIGFNEDMGNRSGVVIWSTMLDNQSCRAGIRFA
jgi:response regulator RpfG family c-di-GMP phosphodiesterase